MFEDFTLSTNIAAGCEVIVEGANAGTCGMEYGTMVLFQEEITGCKRKVPLDDDGSYNGMCYHVPIENNNLFNS